MLICVFIQQQTINDDITGQKARARDLVSASKRLRRESSSEEDPVIREKLDELKLQTDTVAKMSADRLSLLEQAAPLAAHFHETHSDLIQGFNEIEEEVRKQETPGLNAEQIKEQQDAIKVSFKEEIIKLFFSMGVTQIDAHLVTIQLSSTY